MANRFMRFAEEAIEKAGKVGERKREHAIRLAEMGAKSRMAERERAETGLTRRKGMKIAGAEREKELEWIRGTGESARAKTGLRGAGMKPRDTFADRTAAYKQAGKQMESLFPADAEGFRINPATGKPFTEKEWGGYRQTFANKALEYAGGGLPREEIDPMAGKGFISTDSDVWSVDEDLPYEQQITRRPQTSRRRAMMRAGLGDEEIPPPMEMPKIPQFRASFGGREAMYDTGITPRNIFRRGISGIGEGISGVGGWVKDAYGRWVKKTPTTGMGRYGQVFRGQ